MKVPALNVSNLYILLALLADSSSISTNPAGKIVKESEKCKTNPFNFNTTRRSYYRMRHFVSD